MITGVVLAAGTSSRLGRPKQLLPFRGRPILQHVVDVAAAAGLHEVVVVLGHEAERVEREITLRAGGRTVVNPEYAAGQSTSLRAGLEAAGPETTAAIVLLGDQPEVSAEAVRAVADAYREGSAPVVRASYGGRPGHPVLLERTIWNELAAVTGDTGARDLLIDHPDWVRDVELGGDPPPDVDTEEDYERLLEREGRSRRG